MTDSRSSNISFDYCSFSARSIAIELKGGSSHVSVVNSMFSGIGHPKTENFIVIRGDKDVFAEHIEIKDNVFVDPLFQALHITAARNLNIEGNRFEGIQQGVLANNTRHLVMANNWFFMITKADHSNIGIYISEGVDSKIYNNFIHSSGTHSIFGIRLRNTSNAGVFFNTMNLKSNRTESKALWVQNGMVTDVKNNIIKVHRGFPVYIDGLSDGLTIDYNNYYNPLGLVGYMGSDISNFEIWKNMIKGDSNSSFLDPLFASDTNPLPYEKFLNGAGITIQDVTRDIYGLPRFEPPDMGCMEFFIDYGIAALEAPVQECLFSDAEAITVVIQRHGDVPLEDFEVAVQLNDGDVYIDRISGDFHGTYTHTFTTTFDLSAYVTHKISVSLQNIRDDNQNNDHDEFLLVSPEPLHITYETTDPLCLDRNGGLVDLTISGGIPPYAMFLDGVEQDVLQYLTLFTIENLSPATYTLSVIDDIGCDIALVFEIAPAVPMAPLITASDEGGQVPFQIEFSFDVYDESLMDSWLWRVGTLTETTRTPTFTFDREGVHEVILEVFSGYPGHCMEQASYTVLAELEELVVGVDIQPQLCVDGDLGSVTLTIEGGIPPFMVYFNDEGMASTYDREIAFSNLEPGIHTIVVVDAFGQVQSHTENLPEPILMNPVIYAADEYGRVYTDTIYGVIPFEVWFSFSANEMPVSYTWFYDDQADDNFREYHITFNQEGELKVTLEVGSGDPYQCFETTEFVIFSERKVVITPIEVITPDGGGLNEYFEVISKGLLSLRVDIFDRRGRRVNGYEGLDGRWYGNYENEAEAPDGMYPFYLSGTGFDNHKYEQSGLIRLIRETANLFPNPASQSVNIDVGNTLSAPMSIEIIDYKGNRVFFDRRDDVDYLITLDVSGLQKGIYLVRLSDGDRIMNKKLWIARP